ncbi:hypothetical protein PROFUN_11956 [Planoprotostelium fungivorum]|uniref:Uncharacterized protein n=1 Tax=Planoprotostelium fungivorum TaxID=1890364 RepID=A0A2P6N8Z8_9EUKA|nr:hypothetical protein PROFUN_11956 [Planoprotostelium fungivorum]
MTSKMNAVLEDHYPAGYTGKRLNATLTAHYKNQATRELKPVTPWINSYQSAVVRNNSSTLLQEETYKPAGYSGHIAQSQEHFGKTVGQVVRESHRETEDLRTFRADELQNKQELGRTSQLTDEHAVRREAGKDKDDYRPSDTGHIPGYQGHINTYRDVFGKSYTQATQTSPILQKSLRSRPTTATSRNTDGSQMDRVYNERDEDDTAANHFRTTNKDSHNRKVLVTPDSFLPKEGRIPGYTGFQPVSPVIAKPASPKPGPKAPPLTIETTTPIEFAVGYTGYLPQKKFSFGKK